MQSCSSTKTNTKHKYKNKCLFPQVQNVEAGALACSVYLHRTAATSSSSRRRRKRRRRRRRRRRCIGLAKRHRGAAAAQGAAGSPLLCSAARSALQTCLLCRALCCQLTSALAAAAPHSPHSTHATLLADLAKFANSNTAAAAREEESWLESWRVKC